MPMSRNDIQLYMLKFNQIVIRLMDQVPNFLEEVFAPRMVIKQMLLATALHGSMIVWSGVYGKLMNFYSHYFSGLGKKLYKLEQKMANCHKYVDWLKLAKEHDALSGKLKWRQTDESSLINTKGLRQRIREIEHFMEKDEPVALMFRLGGNLSRNQYGTQHEEMHTVAMSGTKMVVVEYNEAMEKAFEYLCDCDENKVSLEDKLTYFSELRHAYGRTALLLSGGAYLGYYHMGIFDVLYANGMLPRVISGASAGSLMAAIVGTKTDEELDAVFKHLKPGEIAPYRRDFFKFSNKIKSPIGTAVQSAIPASIAWITDPLLALLFDGKMINLDIEHLSQVAIDNVGHCTFQEAFDLTGRIINITVAPLNQYDPPRLLNYLTAPHVCVWSAAVASCAIPNVFDPIQLVMKPPKGVDVSLPRSVESKKSQKGDGAGGASGYSDGSIESDLPMAQVSEMFNVNHFIISQVNPHSAVFSSLSLKGGAALYKYSLPFRIMTGFVQFLKEESKSWIVNLWSFAMSMSGSSTWSMKRGMYSTVTQKYEGSENDITISPWSGHISLPRAWTSLIKNPTDEEYSELWHASEVAMFPLMPKVKARCRIETALDRCTQKLKHRLNSEYAKEKARGLKLATNGHLKSPTAAGAGPAGSALPPTFPNSPKKGSTNNGNSNAEEYDDLDSDDSLDLPAPVPVIDRTPSFHTSRDLAAEF
jgi:TAG lipase/steryl ester hydrolase/phospholipase A2/LPA acyltransferase